MVSYHVLPSKINLFLKLYFLYILPSYHEMHDNADFGKKKKNAF